MKRGYCKRLIAWSLAAALLLGTSGLTAFAADMKGAYFTAGNPPFAYVITGLKAEDGADTVKLYQDPNMQSYSGYIDTYTIPERVYNSSDMTSYAVTEIGGAVGDTVLGGLQNVSLAGINLPGTVKTIGSKAFAQCANMTELTLPTSVTRLAADAFSGVYLQKLTLSVTEPVTMSADGSYLPKDGSAAVILPRTVTDLRVAEGLTVTGTLSLPGDAALLNGSITVRSGAVLTVDGSLSGTGTVSVANNGSLSLQDVHGFRGTLRLEGTASSFVNRSSATINVVNAKGQTVPVQPGAAVQGGDVSQPSGGDDTPSAAPQITANEGGTVTVKEGGKVVEITAAEGYHVEAVVINGHPMGTITRYEFQEASRQNTVAVTFAPGKAQEGPEEPGVFKDVPKNAPYAEAVSFLTDLGIFQGVSDDRFGPDLKVTRAAMLYLLYRLEVYDSDFSVYCREPVNPFADVQDGSFYAEAVAWAVGTNICGRGYTLQPNKEVTREEMCLYLYRYTRARGYAALVDAGRYHSYRDGALLGGESRKAMCWAAGMKYLKTKNYVLNPGGTVTRAEAAEALARYLKIN